MSVEEALKTVKASFSQCGHHDPGYCPRHEPIQDAALDALVREVRAEMPCYRSAYTYAGGDEAFYDPRGFDYSACAETLYRGEPLCPACTARAEREALKVEAG